MKTIKCTMELTYDEEIMYSDDEDEKSFFVDLLTKHELILHSNELGDEIGTVKLVGVEDLNL